MHRAYARLETVLWASSGSPLNLHNQVEILQNAREKYPRLMVHLRRATGSIPLLSDEWTSDLT
jgi:hypothetical protein